MLRTVSLSTLPAHVLSIRTPADIDLFIERSAGHPALLFKHSTACGTSMEALEQLKAYLASPDYPSGMPVAVVRVIEERPLSLQLAERIQVRHQSPQAILVKDGKPLWQASHYSITRDALHKAVQQHLHN